MTVLSTQIKNAALVRRGLENLADETPKIGASRIYDRMVRAQKKLKTPGKAIRYPVNWDSERQRRAFFATDGFGRGIPTRRTDTYVRGWKIRRNPRASRATEGYSLINDVNYSKHVGGTAYGTSQSRIHRGRWVMTRTTLEEATKGLPKEVAEHIGMVARREKLK